MFLFGNGAFGSKWCGLWKNDIKFLEYFAVRVNGKWLSPRNFQNLQYNGITAELTYNAGQKVVQKMCVGDKGVAIKISTEKESEFDVEFGANIRKRNENLHSRKYSVSKRKGIYVKNDLGKLFVRLDGAVFTPLNQYERHFPGKYALEQGYDWQEDEQEKFVPGILSTKGKKIELSFSVGGGVDNFDVLKKNARLNVRKHAKTSGWRLAASLSHFITSMNGKNAFFAGFPYFNEFWTRDFLWMAAPLMDSGFTEEVQSALSLIGENQLANGEIPNIIGNQSGNADSTPLWILASDDLFFEKGELDSARVKKALNYGVKKFEKGFISHPINRTWMDTLERRNAIEVQSLWVEAFERGSELFEDTKLSDMAANIWENIESHLLVHDVFQDATSGPYRFTANSLVPLVFEQASLGQRNKTLKMAEKELVTQHGIKAVGKSESSRPERYHERVWGLTTYWGLLTLKETTARKMLNGYLRFLDSRTLYGMPETISEGVPKGATHQLWSIAFLPTLEGEYE